MDRIKNLDEVNRKCLEDYIRHSQLQGLKPTSIGTRTWKVFAFMKFINLKDAKTATQEDVESFYLTRKEKVSPFTLQVDLVEVRQFLRWLLGSEKEEALFRNVKFKKPKRQLPEHAVITEEDVRKLVDVAESQRDRAIIMFLWDSGARLSEMLGIDVGQVQFDRYGATVVLDGKTGMRNLRLIDSVPDLQKWIEMHPSRENPKAPLFCSLRGPAISRLKPRSVQGRLITLAKRARVAKRIHPHGFRHGKLTALTREGFTEADLKLIAGWAPGSNMAETYVHLSLRDVEQKILRMKGLVTDEDKHPENLLKPKKCYRCGRDNSHDAAYCSACSLILDSKVAIEVMQAEEQAVKEPEYKTVIQEIEELKRRIRVMSGGKSAT